MRNLRKPARAALFTFALAAVVTYAPPRLAVAGDSTGITEDNVIQKVGEASTNADHQALATYFRGEAKIKGDRVAKHEAMLKSWATLQGKSQAFMHSHCQNLISSYAAEAKALEELAKEHEKLLK